nr:hypothetical protein [uncultured Rhodoferax sp.]
MIIDTQLQMSAKQPVTGTANSTNTIDIGPSLGALYTPDMVVPFLVRETVTAAGAATVTFQVIAGDTPDMATPQVILSSAAIPKADLVRGKVVYLRVPETTRGTYPKAMRYLAARYIVNNGPLTAGSFDAWLAPWTGIEQNTAYPASPRVK